MATNELRHLGRTTWEEIEIGEVFGVDSCFSIMYKIDEKHAILLAEDFGRNNNWIGKKFKYLGDAGCSDSYWNPLNYPSIEGESTLRKLPLSVQRLWKTE